MDIKASHVDPHLVDRLIFLIVKEDHNTGPRDLLLRGILRHHLPVKLSGLGFDHIISVSEEIAQVIADQVLLIFFCRKVPVSVFENALIVPTGDDRCVSGVVHIPDNTVGAGDKIHKSLGCMLPVFIFPDSAF